MHDVLLAPAHFVLAVVRQLDPYLFQIVEPVFLIQGQGREVLPGLFPEPPVTAFAKWTSIGEVVDVGQDADVLWRSTLERVVLVVHELQHWFFV